MNNLKLTLQLRMSNIFAKMLKNVLEVFIGVMFSENKGCLKVVKNNSKTSALTKKPKSFG